MNYAHYTVMCNYFVHVCLVIVVHTYIHTYLHYIHGIVWNTLLPRIFPSPTEALKGHRRN